jgi:hypothetical protein
LSYLLEEKIENDKTIIELGSRKISWLVGGSLRSISNNWSARHRENHDILREPSSIVDKYSQLIFMALNIVNAHKD